MAGIIVCIKVAYDMAGTVQFLESGILRIHRFPHVAFTPLKIYVCRKQNPGTFVLFCKVEGLSQELCVTNAVNLYKSIASQNQILYRAVNLHAAFVYRKVSNGSTFRYDKGIICGSRLDRAIAPAQIYGSIGHVKHKGTCCRCIQIYDSREVCTVTVALLQGYLLV